MAADSCLSGSTTYLQNVHVAGNSHSRGMAIAKAKPDGISTESAMTEVTNEGLTDN